MRIRGLNRNFRRSGGAQPSLIQRAISALRRLNATSLYVPDDLGLVLGPELVTNGDFSGSTTGWAATNGATIAVVGGELELTASATGYPIARQGVSTTVGKSYRITTTARRGTTAISLAVNAVGNVLSFSGATNETKTTSFSATATTTTLELVINGASPVAGTTAYFDNISVREILSATTYIDTTGRTPVTAINDLVGLLTDRRYGVSNAGPERITNPGPFTTTTGWSADVGLSLSAVGGSLRTTSTVSGASARIARQTLSGLTVGATYRITATVGAFGGAGAQGANPQIQVRNAADTATTASLLAPSLTNCTITGVFVATDTSHRIRPRWDGNASTDTTSYLDWGGVSVTEVLGNHATQSAVASKPTLSRVPKRLGPNLVTNGDGTSTAGWVQANSSLAVSGGEFVMTGVNGTASRTGVFLATTVGRTYKFTGSSRMGTEIANTFNFVVRSATASHFGALETVLVTSAGSNSAPTLHALTFTATTAITAIYLDRNTSNGGTTFFDNVEVREVLEWTPAVKFDGSNDLMTLSPGAILQRGSDHWVAAAFVLDAVGAQQTIYASSNTASNNPIVCQIFVDTADGKIKAAWRDDSGIAVLLAGPLALTGTPYVVSAFRSSGTGYLHVNGTLAASGSLASLGTTTVNNASIGASVLATTVNFANMKLIDIAISQSTLTETDRKLIERAMGAKMGLTL